ncbi:hypothetical protein F5Y13DRAFT_169969 [Hypoxylon sp. FL1857]|nr:hypothetical protein F5Y13DRAFT_169969 [Hypoxylon sp. FL1857]
MFLLLLIPSSLDTGTFYVTADSFLGKYSTCLQYDTTHSRPPMSELRGWGSSANVVPKVRGDIFPKAQYGR